MDPIPAHADAEARVIATALAGRSDVDVAVLFGSVARGNATTTSDVDVAVLTPPSADLLELSAVLARCLGREVDVVALASADIPMLMSIARDGVVVHESRRGAGAAWRARALADLEIDGPWYTRMRDAWLERVARGGLSSG